MTPGEIIEVAQNRLNAVTDTLWSTTELLKYLYLCETELAIRSRCIRSTATDTSVASTADYSTPQTAFELTRVEYDGRALQDISRRQNDAINYNQTTALTGTPNSYVDNGSTVTLVPTPDTSALTIRFRYYALPTEATGSSDALSTPAAYHHLLCDGVTAQMCPKDLGHPLTALYAAKWEKDLAWAEAHARRSLRGNKFAVVLREEDALSTNTGII